MNYQSQTKSQYSTLILLYYTKYDNFCLEDACTLLEMHLVFTGEIHTVRLQPTSHVSHTW